MNNPVTLEELQGAYEIRYQSTPQMPNWYEPGTGAAVIEGNTLKGVDALGMSWLGEFAIEQDNTISYKAVIDPKGSPPTAGVLDNNGMMSRLPQTYEGELTVTKVANLLIIKTTVQQGPISIHVQFIKKA